MLERSGDKYFGAKDRESLVKIQRNLRTVAMTLISFYQVDHTYDRAFLTKYVDDLKKDLKDLVRPHLTEKSLGRYDHCSNNIDFQYFTYLIPFFIYRIEHVMGFLGDAEFLDSLYVPKKNEDVAKQMGVLINSLNKCVEEGVLWMENLAPVSQWTLIKLEPNSEEKNCIENCIEFLYTRKMLKS